MSEETKQEATNSENTRTLDTEAQSASADAPAATSSEDTGKGTASSGTTQTRQRGRRDDASADRRKNPRRPRRGGRRTERAHQEYEQKIINIRRVTRVMAGGRRFSFSVAVVIGDKKGKVGVGIGKAGDTQLAIEKAVRNARKNIFVVPMDKDHHIPHDVHVKYASSEVMIMPAPGMGLVAGSSVRTVLELGGVKDVTAKIFSRSKNKLNNAKAAIEALKQLKSK